MFIFLVSTPQSVYTSPYPLFSIMCRHSLFSLSVSLVSISLSLSSRCPLRSGQRQIALNRNCNYRMFELQFPFYPPSIHQHSHSQTLTLLKQFSQFSRTCNPMFHTYTITHSLIIIQNEIVHYQSGSSLPPLTPFITPSYIYIYLANFCLILFFCSSPCSDMLLLFSLVWYVVPLV